MNYSLADKHSLRKWARDKRKELDMDNISSELVCKLKQTEIYKNSRNIMLFYPLSNEVNLLPLLEDDSKNFYLPKIDGENLLCCPYKDGDELCVSCFKTLEPKSAPCEKFFIDLAIIPALAVDKNNYRLGYGGGFYDRFLKDFRGRTLVCIPKELKVDTIYPEKTDVAVDIVIS